LNPVPVKRWSVTVLSDVDGPLRLFAGHEPDTEWSAGTRLDLSPVELLLLAVGTCYALSCRAALAARRLPRVGFRVTTLGVKAIDAPVRLAHIDNLVSFDAGLVQADAEAVAADAKALCTVSNTILLPPEMTLRVLAQASVPPASSD